MTTIAQTFELFLRTTRLDLTQRLRLIERASVCQINDAYVFEDGSQILEGEV